MASICDTKKLSEERCQEDDNDNKIVSMPLAEISQNMPTSR
jgi:hypothetical protein